MSIEKLIQKSNEFKLPEDRIDKVEKGRLSFIKQFPLDSIKNMTLDEYVQGTDKNSFCYWLEFNNIMFGIGGGSALKFGLYKTKENGKLVYKSGSPRNMKVMDDKKADLFFKTIKDSILKALELTKNDRIDEIKNLKTPVFNIVMLKILAIYYPEKFLSIGRADEIIKLAESIGLEGYEIRKDNLIELNYACNKMLRSKNEFKDLNYEFLSSFLWEEFNPHLNESSENKPASKIDSNFLERLDELKKVMREEVEFWNDFDYVSDKIKNDYVWIYCPYKKIGNKIAHYEIKTRKLPKSSNKYILNVDLHFEASNLKNKNIFKDRLTIPEDKIQWINWQSSMSMRVIGGVDSNSDNAANDLKDKLVLLETTVGDQVRNILDEIEKGEGKKSKKQSSPLNQILYGPPGTGKTYHTVNKALEIIGVDTKGKERKDLKEIFNEKVKEEQIVFSTFHQSMSYEDFIEGIKPLEPDEGDTTVKYEIQSGIFKLICDRARKISTSKRKVDWEKPTYYKMSLGGKHRQEIHDWCIENNVISLGYGGEEDLSELKTIEKWEDYKNKFSEKFPDLVKDSRYHIQAAYWFMYMKKGDVVVISKGNNIIDAIGIIKGDYYWSDQNPIKFYHYRDVEWIATNLNTAPGKFLRKQISQMTLYQIHSEDVVVESFQALTDEKKEEKNYVLIIDEINRGNVSQIFGELITLIEEDKRKGKDEQLEVMLPYSKKAFSVPPNLYIIGTMNTADRSVEALDTALRRRFCFVEMPPRYDLDELDYDVFGFKAGSILRVINSRLEKLLDKDHCIGHSYFILKDGADGEEALKETFYRNIIPLMQEYFFGDFGKIGLVLGKGFVRKKEWKDIGSFADFGHISLSDFESRDVYEIIDHRLSNDSGNFFKEALNILMKGSVE